MSEQNCIIAYDHDDDLDECAVCGWRPEGLRIEPISNSDVARKINMLNEWMRANCHGEK